MENESNNLKNLEDTYLSRVAEIWGVLSGEDNVALESTYIKPNASSLGRNNSNSRHLSRTLSDTLLDNQYLVLLGEPGIGKSTTLQFLAWCFAREGETLEKLDLLEHRVPILLSSKTDYWRGIETENVETALEKEVSLFLPTEKKKVPELVKGWLTEGKLIVLIDGLDEIPESSREHVVYKLHLFANVDDYRRCRVVVTSRLANYRSLGHPFSEFILQPFGGNDLIRYATVWLASTKKIEAKDAEPLAADLINKVRAESGLRNIIGNPLFLKLLISTNPDPNQLPSNVSEIIGNFIRIYAWERAKKRKEPRWAFDDCHKVLVLVAWILQNYSEEDNNEERLIGFIEKKNPDIKAPREILNYLSEGMGLIEIGRFSRAVRFNHVIFREYFVAWRIAKQWEKDPSRAWLFIKPRLHNLDWRWTLILSSLILDQTAAQDYVSHILKAKSPDENLLHRDKILAGICLVWGAKIKPSLRFPTVGKLTDIYSSITQHVNTNSRFQKLPSSIYATKHLLESILQSVTPDEQAFIEEKLIKQILSSERLSLREALHIIWTEIFERAKRLLPKRHSDNPLEEIWERHRSEEFRDPLLKGIPKELKLQNYWKWNRNVRIALLIIGELRTRSSRTKKLALHLLSDWRLAESAANALVKIDGGTLETATELLSAIQFYRNSEDIIRYNSKWGSIVDALGELAQKNHEIVEWMIQKTREPESDEEGRAPQISIYYPLAIAICRAAETNITAMEFVLNYWSSRREKEFHRSLQHGMQEGTNAIQTVSEEVIQYIIDQIKGYQEYPNYASRLLERVLGETSSRDDDKQERKQNITSDDIDKHYNLAAMDTPQIMQKQSDGRGNIWYAPVNMSISQFEEVQKRVLKTIASHPLIGARDETALIAIITRWMLKSPSFLIKLYKIVADSDTKLLAENLKHFNSPEQKKRWGWEEKEREFLRLIIKRLLDPDPSVSEAEFARWKDIAESSESDLSPASWSMNVTNWQKCNVFYSMYWQTYGIFWVAGMDFSGGYEKVKFWNPYSMAALVSFAEWAWSSPNFLGQGKNVGWKKAEEEFLKGTGLAISVIKDHNPQIIDSLEGLLIAKSPSNKDSAIFGDRRKRRREVRMDERIAAIYALARLSREFPKTVEILLPIAHKLENTYIDDEYTAVPPFSEFREHLIRSLGFTYRPSREIVQLMFNTVKRDHEKGVPSIIEVGIEAIENPLSDAVEYLISEFEEIENPFWKTSILKPLLTVKTPSPEINKIMLTALTDEHENLSVVAREYFSTIPNLDSSWIDQLIELAATNINALKILASQARNIGKDKIIQLTKIARKKTENIGDDYRDILMKFQTRLSELNIIGLPRELETIATPVSLKLMRGAIVFLGIILLLGLLVVLDTIYGAAQSTIQDFLGQSIKQWITTHPAVFISIFIGLGVLIGLLAWLVEKMKEKL